VLGPPVNELLPLQRNILDSACRMVKPGGRLVYATCSLLAEENENQIEAFLGAHPEFQIKGDFLKLTPAVHDTDGFFAAVLTKKNIEAAP
jgi:16S rRNA (cytosine967-C5)-methyltransferase